jgi:hypothetical protein
MTWMHASELAIDRLVAGELSPVDAAAVRDHAASCASCHALLADALSAQRTFDAPFSLSLSLALATRRRIAPVLAASVAALAAALALVIAWPRGEPAVRAKGTAIVGFFVAHGDHVRRGGPGEHVVPGDRIELYTTTFEPTWFAAISGDGSVYVEPRRISPGYEQVLPLAIELDATPGSEVVTGVFCPAPFDPHAIGADCAIDRFTLVKARP